MTTDADTRPFFEALKNGRILIQMCPQCRSRQFPPRAVCVKCGAAPEWSEIEGLGIIYSITTCHRPGQFWLADRVPYSVALVDLHEGVRMLGRVAGEAVDADAIGSAVRAQIGSNPGGIPTVIFRLTNVEDPP